MNSIRQVFLGLAAALALTASGAALGAMTSFQEGVNYVAISPPQPTSVQPGQIEVIEFFWYGCPHCFAYEPYVEAWLAHKPKNVVFKRIPGALPNSEWLTDAQAYYTAEALGLEPKIHEPLFNAIHLQGQYALTRDKNALRQFFSRYGASAQQFDAAWNSFGVKLKMDQAAQLEQRYGLQGVPTFIINGKWMTGAGYQMAPADAMRCVQYLVAKEQAALRGKKK